MSRVFDHYMKTRRSAFRRMPSKVEEMAVYDTLPAPVRHALQERPTDLPAHRAQQILETSGSAEAAARRIRGGA